MSKTLGRMSGLLLGAVLLAAAAPAQMFHNLYYIGDQPNELTSVRSAFNGGFVASANFPDGAAMVKLLDNGDLQWTRHYEGPLPLQIVKVGPHNPYNAWIGNEAAAGKTIPVIAATKHDGDMKWARRIELGMNAEARDLGTDDNTYWVGGTGWPGGDRADPWMARFHDSGTLQWARSFHFDYPCQLNALSVADDGGAVGVGQALVGVQGTIRQRLFAFKVNGAGNLEWAMSYEAQKVDLSVSQQWLADVTYAGTLLQVAGVVTGVCTDPSSANCVPRPRSILVGAIDQKSGSLQTTWIISDPHGRALWANTIAMSQDRVAIGGRVDTSTDSEALLLSGVFENQVSFLQGKLFGDGPGLYPSEVEDLALVHNSAPAGFVLTTRQRHDRWRPAIVRTNDMLSAAPAGQSCESNIPLVAASISTTPTELPWTRNNHTDSDVKIEDTLIQPTQAPCAQLLP